MSARQTSTVRAVPRPFWNSPKGICRWCGASVPAPSGVGRDTRTRWHPDCQRDFRVASGDVRFTVALLIERDGPRCTDCGEIPDSYEVDHEIPLWKVADLPPERRIKYFGLENLKLRCVPCHKRKNGKEAAERAHFNRLAGVKPKRSPLSAADIRDLPF